ncbi:MAG: hemolysin family protein [Gemmatimonadales bacterium]
MILLVLILGLAFAVAGATATAVLVAESRRALTRMASRRLRGGTEFPGWLHHVGADLTAAATATALGAVILGADLPALLGNLGPTAFALAAVLLGVPAILIVAYLAPRWLARIGAVRSAGVVVPIIRPWARLLRPVLPAAGETDPHALMREAASGGLGVDPELVMAGGVMTFSERPVRDVLTPRTALVAVPEGASRSEIAEAFQQSGYSRLPLYRGTLDEVVGMLHVFDLFTVPPESPLPVRPVTMAPASRSCGDLLLEMQRERRHIAVVLDEFGGTLGIVTLEDLLEALVGEIFDEYDEAPGAATGTVPATSLLEADATTPVAAVADRFAVAFPATAATTVAGMLAELAGRIPVAGDRFSLRGLDFEVLQSTPARAERILIRTAGRSVNLDLGTA